VLLVAEPVEEVLVDAPVPVLPSEAVVLPVPVLLIEDPVPVLPEELVLAERVVPVTLNGSVMTVKSEDPVSVPGNGQHGRHTHCSVGGETSANITSIVASMFMIKMLYVLIMSSACKISSSVKDDVNFAEKI